MQWSAGACVDYGWDGGLTENEKFEGNINLEDYLYSIKTCNTNEYLDNWNTSN